MQKIAHKACRGTKKREQHPLSPFCSFRIMILAWIFKSPQLTLFKQKNSNRDSNGHSHSSEKKQYKVDRNFLHSRNNLCQRLKIDVTKID